MLKSIIKINDVVVEIESSSSSELVETINKIIKGRTEITAEVKPKKRELYYKRSYPNKSEMKSWTEKDIIGIAKLATEYGKNPINFEDIAFDFIKENGDVKDRLKDNVRIISRRIHKYIFTGIYINISEKIMYFLKKNGYKYYENQEGKEKMEENIEI